MRLVDGHDERFLGTGMLVAKDVVVTCAHVIAGCDRIAVQLRARPTRSAGGSRRGVVAAQLIFPVDPSGSRAEALATHADDDVAVLRLDAEAGAALDAEVAPLGLLEDVRPPFLRAVADQLEVRGFASARGAPGIARGLLLRGSLWTRPDGTVHSGQLDGGMPPGSSGSPLLLHGPEPWVAGILFLGGEGAGQSTFYGADLLLSVLGRLGIDPRVRRATTLASAPARTLGREPLDRPIDSAHGEPDLADSAIRCLRGSQLAQKYEVEQVLGHGGMGVVLAARHRGLDEPVALKLLHPHLVGGHKTSARFEREARTVAKLRSDHVVRVRDMGCTEQGVPYIVMERLEGEDLARRVARGPLPVGEAAQFVRQACSALEEAHAQGIVHRDLKPANLFLTSTRAGAPHIKVLDFGVAKALTEDGDFALTDAHQVIGSPLYMAPEQMRSAHEVSVASDVWSLGIVLFELLTGDLPFRAQALAELCRQITSDPVPSLAARRADLPPGLVEVVNRCLQKEPQARYRSARALAEALLPFTAAPGGLPSVRTRAPNVRRALLVGLALLTALLLGRSVQSSLQSARRAPPSDPAHGREAALLYGVKDALIDASAESTPPRSDSFADDAGTPLARERADAEAGVATPAPAPLPAPARTRTRSPRRAPAADLPPAPSAPVPTLTFPSDRE